MSQLNKNLNDLPVIELAGTCREMGQQFGEACRSQCRELYEIRLQAAIKHAKDRGREFSVDKALRLAGSSLSIVKDFDEEQQQENLGIAEGSGLTPEQVFILQGLTDFRDYLSFGRIPDGFGCTAMLISPQRTKHGGNYLAQNWDLASSNMPYVCFVKRNPVNAPETISLTITGGLSMIALNSEGLAVGTTNLKATDSRPGVHYLNIIHRVMKCSSVNDASNIIKNAVRSGAHYYMLADKSACISGIECTALKSAELKENNGVITHCNHFLDPGLKHLQAEDMGESTQHRQQRVDTLTNKTDFNIDEIKKILSDSKGDKLAICRYNCQEDISTNGSVIISPSSGEIHACRSQPDKGNWKTFTF